MENKNKKLKALIITGKSVKDQEFVYPFYRLQEEGFVVDVAIRGMQTVQGEFGIPIVPTRDIAGIDPAEYDLLVLPGGVKCIEYLRQDLEILNFISEFDRRGKTIASICHGASLLISAKVVKNRRISGYYSIKDDINNAGGIYTDEPAVVFGNIVSTAHYKHLGPWMAATLKVVYGNKNKGDPASNIVTKY